ncbi:MAG: Ig-like domain-containing protein, partial [Oscillospiraceae bacterium]|nr:Ig-like domain-containing protein [Oscillospiraceae bacterium]
MANHKKSKNSFSKSLKYVFSQAKAGSLLHIGIITAVLLALMLPIGLTACNGGGDVENGGYVENEADQTYDKDREALDVEQLGITVLKETEDAGQEYIDNTLFIGDSNTVRTQVYGHTTWDNVVAAVSMGVQHIPKLEMTYFKGMENPVTVPRAVKIIQPQRIIITYGTNNTLGFTVEDFIKMYREGIQAIEKQWPYADIIINAIPPVDKERENLAITMQTIDKMNKALAEMAKEDGYKFLNSAEALKDEETGFAKKDYTISDGVHLSKKGMDALFEYFRTHAYITEDRRPQPLKPVPERKETPTGIITEDPIAVRGTKIKVVFKSNDESLGTVSGEVEQKLKRTQTSSGVGPQPNVENGGVFTGWSCSYEGLSSTVEDNITYTVPKVGEEVSEITVYCNFEKAKVTVKADGAQADSISLDSGKSKQLSASITKGFKGDKKITWTSENTAVATVDENGKVTAVSGGKTQIVASILNNKIYAVLHGKFCHAVYIVCFDSYAFCITRNTAVTRCTIEFLN